MLDWGEHNRMLKAQPNAIGTAEHNQMLRTMAEEHRQVLGMISTMEEIREL
jgi:hypothetical protein